MTQSPAPSAAEASTRRGPSDRCRAVGPRADRLDFTDGEDFSELAPEIGQTFFIGDGVGRIYRVTADATRLFLGFADAFNYVGAPGWYANNGGSLEVTVAWE